MEELARMKLGIVARESIFLKITTDNFISYYQDLIPWVNTLWKEVFPMDKLWEKEEQALYQRLREVLARHETSSQYNQNLE